MLSESTQTNNLHKLHKERVLREKSKCGDKLKMKKKKVQKIPEQKFYSMKMNKIYNKMK